jgi:aspartate 1-decarboxylase
MLNKFLKAKLHRATVTRSDLNYPGSIAIDENLLEAAGIAAFEAVQVWNVSNGSRLETYALPSPRGSGEVCLNGAAARHAEAGDIVIVAAFCFLAPEEASSHSPIIVVVGENNRIATYSDR